MASPTESRANLFTTKATKSGICSLPDGYHIAYEIHGLGPTKVFLIMGLLASMYSWRQSVNYFAGEHGDRYSVCVFDNRGAGKSSAPWSRYTTAQLANDAGHLLNCIGWTEANTIHVNGVSMGGMVALELVSANPARFASLALTSSCAKHQNPPRTRLESIDNWISFFRPKRSNEAKAKSVIDSLFVDRNWLQAPNERYPAFATNYERVYSEIMDRITHQAPTTLAGQIGQIAACLTHHVSHERLVKIAREVSPILLLTGDHDKLVSPECTEELGREMKEARKVVFYGKGHALSIEAEEEYHAELEKLILQAEKRWRGHEKEKSRR